MPEPAFDPDKTVPVLMAGRRVLHGRHEQVAEAGRGSMGVVWHARDEELGETVALKFLPADVACDAAAVDKLKDETRCARPVQPGSLPARSQILNPKFLSNS